MVISARRATLAHPWLFAIAAVLLLIFGSAIVKGDELSFPPGKFPPKVMQELKEAQQAYQAGTLKTDQLEIIFLAARQGLIRWLTAGAGRVHSGRWMPPHGLQNRIVSFGPGGPVYRIGN